MKLKSAGLMSAAVLVASALLPSATTLANDTRPTWIGTTQACSFRFEGSSCDAAIAAVDAAVRICSPTLRRLGDPAPCPTGAAEPIFFVTENWLNPANNLVSLNANVFCPERVNLFLPAISTPDGMVCSLTEHAPSRNLGKPKCCDGKNEGNPVNPAIGNKFQEEIDYVGSGAFPLKLVRYYNSLSGGEGSQASRLGRHWTHTYSRSLLLSVGPAFAIVTAVREDGRVVAFNRASADHPYLNEPASSETLQKTAGGWKLVTDDEQTELYDGAGRLSSVRMRSGLTQTLSYDASGRVASVTDAFGRSLLFGYDNLGRLIMVTSPGGLYQYAYTNVAPALNDLRQVTYPDTKVRGYRYIQGPAGINPQSLLTGIIDENGVQFATFSYTNGLVVSTERAGGAGKVTLVNSTAAGIRNVTVTRFVSAAQSIARTYTYQSIVGISSLTGIAGLPCPSCGPQAATYDANANVSSRTDWNGNRTNYAYDLARNLETLRTEGLTAVGGTTPQTRTVTTEWHPGFRLVNRVAEPLRITTNAYDASGNLLSKSLQATTDSNGSQGFSAAAAGAPRVWAYTYNENGQVLTADGPRTDAADVTTYTYYANDDPDLGKRGNVATITSAAGHTTSITAYNAHGQPLSVVDPNGLTTTLAYDARQRLTSRSVGGEATAYTYDNAGQLTKVTLPDLSFLSYSYDPAHRLIGMQDNLGNRIAYTLDLAGNRTKEEVFDPANALAQTRSRVYSSLNRLSQELGASSQTTEYAYDNQGNLTSVKDPLNHLTTNQYDPLNRLKQVTDPATGITQYAYNGLGALTQVIDPRSLATGYAVDGLGNLNQQVSPDTGTTANTYDAGGNLLTQTDAKGQTTSYAYDVLNRVTLITFHDGSKQSYVYDQGSNALGRLSSITERNPANQVTSVIAYAYEQHGRVTSETRTISSSSFVLSYQYDGSGRLSGLTYPSGRTVTYGFDALGRVNQVTTAKAGQSNTVVQGVTYHPFGGVKGFTLGNGQSYTRGYDQDGRIASYTLGASQFAIGYDDVSRITFISDLGNPANSNTYAYDALDRLTQAILPSTPFAYLYDPVGNRLSKTVGSGTESYTYDTASNRLSTLTPTSGPTRSFGFDANGSTVNDGLNSYVYDARGRMMQATSAVGATNYQINALGQRIRKSNSSTDTVFHYDTRGKLIAESDPGGGFYKRELIYLGDMPVGVFQ